METSSGGKEEIEFSAEQSKEFVRLGNGRGCFVPRKLAVVLTIMVITVMILAGLFGNYVSNCWLREDDQRNYMQRTTKSVNVRLPKSLKPLHYRIRLITFLEENSTFQGQVWIRVRCLVRTFNVTLHVVDLAIEEENVTVENDVTGKFLPLVNYSRDEVRQFYIIYLGEEMSVGQKYTVFIKFTGNLSINTTTAFFRSSYKDEFTGNERWLSISQFFPIHARKAFPCFDEPNMKARFEISLGRKQNMTTLSNMPRKSTEPIEEMPGWFWDHFHISELMPTYLVAFMISNLSMWNMGPGLNMWIRSDLHEQMQYAMHVPPIIMQFFQDYLQLPFPLPKLDVVGLPESHYSAMENWGLITASEKLLIHDSAHSTKNTKKDIVSLLAHEIAHQWFGNLVTPKWWGDLWLSEGISRYMDHLAAQSIDPTWNKMEWFVIEVLQPTMYLESLEASHPLSIRIDDPKDVDKILDQITYGKGAALVRMMSFILGSEVFRRGLTSYLNNRKFDNADQDDLWKALSEVAHEDKILPRNMSMKEIMDTWTLQPGYPVLSVQRDYVKGTASLYQERFMILPDQNSNERWWIPVTFTHASDVDFNKTTPEIWFPSQKEELTIRGLPQTNSWATFNVKQAGYYRVNYDIKNWILLIEELNNGHYTKIQVLNRAQLIDDSLNFARAGLLSYNVTFNLLQYLKHEAQYIPWKAALNNFDFLKSILLHNDVYPVFKKYIGDLLETHFIQFANILMANKRDPNEFSASTLVEWACAVDYEPCIIWSQHLYHFLMETYNTSHQAAISDAFKKTVYCTAIRMGREEEWDFGWRLLLDGPQESLVLLHSLSCSQQQNTILRYINIAINNVTQLTTGHAAKALVSLTENPKGFPILLDIISNQWNTFLLRFRYNVPHLKSVMKGIISVSHTAIQLEKVKELLSNVERALGIRLHMHLSTAESNIRWMIERYREVSAWLQNWNMQKKGSN